MQFTPHELAGAAGLFVVNRPDLSGLHVVPGALLVGRGVTPHQLATESVRAGLAARGALEESAVRERVAALGYEYQPTAR